jgi:hypothetical protein
LTTYKAAVSSLNVQVLYIQRVLFDELAAAFHVFPISG